MIEPDRFITEKQATLKGLWQLSADLKTYDEIKWIEKERDRLHSLGVEAEIVLLDKVSTLNRSGKLYTLWRDKQVQYEL